MYNLHPGFLPWGRGYYPVFWALWEQTPAGATMHEISPGVDEGPIVAQSRIEITEDDTGGTLHARVVQAEKRLFRRFWPQFVSGEIPPAVPQVGTGTYHTRREFFDLKRNAHWRSMSTQDMIRLIRAYTFPGCKGLEVHLGRQAFTLTLEQSRAAMAKDCRSRGH
jgi:methionyl-tRNA formyltransferase